MRGERKDFSQRDRQGTNKLYYWPENYTNTSLKSLAFLQHILIKTNIGIRNVGHNVF